VTQQDAEELLLIIDAANRWVAEYQEYCDPKDFAPGYSEQVHRTDYLTMVWRGRLEKLLTPAPAGATS
jgi:hypothetical protein